MKKSVLSNWLLVGVFASLCGLLVVLGFLSDETEDAGSSSMSRSFPTSAERAFQAGYAIS